MGREIERARSRTMALAVADINWFTTESLFRELDRPSASLLGLRCMDYVNGWRKGVYPWSAECRPRPWGQNSVTQSLVLPSGWMKQFPRLGMRPIARVIRRFWRNRPGDVKGLVLTYPHYAYLLDQLDPDVSLYYNIDDYTLYWPSQAGKIKVLEHGLVGRADATVCVSRYRANALRAEVPEAAGKIHHLPHGTPRAFMSENPLHHPGPPPADVAGLPRPLLGYIGTVESRVNWVLMARLSSEFPEGSVVIVGGPPHASRRGESWHSEWAKFASRPNVHHIGWRPQSELPGYYGAFDVILIPYRTDDPFNRACSPTKIADGLGSGRPIVATAIPECRLHAELFDVAEDDASFVAAVRSIVARGSDDGRAGRRHAHAQATTCAEVGGRLLSILDPDKSGGRPPGDAVSRALFADASSGEENDGMGAGGKLHS